MKVTIDIPDSKIRTAFAVLALVTDIGDDEIQEKTAILEKALEKGEIFIKKGTLDDTDYDKCCNAVAFLVVVQAIGEQTLGGVLSF